MKITPMVPPMNFNMPFAPKTKVGLHYATSNHGIWFILSAKA
jgi:hypothetical protein